jgi:uncharacterized protein YigE (DUF2233 family)
MYIKFVILFFVLVLGQVCFSNAFSANIVADTFIFVEVNIKKQELQLLWRDREGKLFSNIENVKTWSEKQGRTLLFSMNGGMYKRDQTAKGLFIQNGKTINPLDSGNGEGNFYLKPNGIFYITTNRQAFICPTENFKYSPAINYATQSGPMLVVNGHIHAAFKKGSANLNIRNAVGLLPNGNLLFVISTLPVNFYDLAVYFQSRGCQYALYLDGAISRMYAPQQQCRQMDGTLGVIIAVYGKK